jgi:hypothetical protein
MGPFQVTPIRVTHSIPDCCGLIMRSEHGSIVHTGRFRLAKKEFYYLLVSGLALPTMCCVVLFSTCRAGCPGCRVGCWAC